MYGKWGPRTRRPIGPWTCPDGTFILVRSPSQLRVQERVRKKSMSHPLEDRIATLARRQHGLVTRGQLLGLGLSAGAVRRRVAGGRLTAVHRGVYLVGLVMPPGAKETAATLACGPGAVVSHRSAAVLWGLVSPLAGDAPVDVTVAERYNRPRRGIIVRRTGALDRDERSVLDGIPVTTVCRTLVDLASVADSTEVERAIARAERDRLVSQKELAKLIARYGGRSGMRVLRRVLHQAGGPALTRSEAEKRLLTLLRRAGLPIPEMNARVGNYEVDCLWVDLSLAVEVDGYRFHRSRPTFEEDRRKATFLAARGIQVIRVTWRQIVDDELTTAVRIAEVLVRAEMR